jgi:hypothetical protein
MLAAVNVRLLLLLIPLSIARAQQADSTWNQHIDAARVSDPATAHEHLVRALALLHGHPDVYYDLARNAVRLQQPEAAIADLKIITGMGLGWDGLDKDTVLAPLHGRPDFDAILAAMAANQLPIGHAVTVATFDDPDLLTEDVAYDPSTLTYYVTSIRKCEILALVVGKRATTFATTLLSPMAIAIDTGRHTLWATIAAMPQAQGANKADSGHTGVVKYDLTTGRLIGRYDLPYDRKAHALGDMTLDASGNAIVSDGSGGGVYMVRRDAQTGTVPSVLVAPGTFDSPQTPAVAPDGRILVPDYGLGVGVISPITHAVSWIAHADTVAMHGIDGMYLVGHTLYAIQNGAAPERVVRFVLDPSLRRVVDWSVVERATPGLGDPTHGVVIGDDFVFIANSGWDRFADDGHITKPAGDPARLVRVSTKQP